MDAMLQVIVDVIPKEDDVYVAVRVKNNGEIPLYIDCLLYTSDAADD